MITRTVTVNWTQVGWHRWPEAEGERHYLALTHRHLFHYTVEMEVEHNDREVEFHDLLDFARQVAPTPDVHLGRMSCEDMAEQVIDKLLARYGRERDMSVTVSEDDEVGATLGWKHDQPA